MTPSLAQRIEHQIDDAIYALQSIEAHVAVLPEYAHQNFIRRVTIAAYRSVEFAHWLLIKEEESR